MTQPSTVRPVFSNEDFSILRELVADAIRNGADDDSSRRLANLHHRLGRFGR